MTQPRLDQLSASDLPCRFGRYVLKSILGEGGMARVFAAELHGPSGFRKQVAIKVIKSKLLEQEDADGAAAFIREARLGGLLRHPNIVDVYEFGEVESQFFISMEWVRGMTLSQLISSRSKAPQSVVLEIAVGIVAGLHSAHAMRSEGLQAGLVHRDLKPSNVLLAWDGGVKVSDFGIATTQYGELATPGKDASLGRGTPSYMSPEQMMWEPVDGRSDVFSFGLVLTELALGRPLPRRFLYDRYAAGGDRNAPVLSDGLLKELDSHTRGLGAMVQKCLAPDPQRRYRSAAGLLDDLERLRDRIGFHPRLRNWLAAEFAPQWSADHGGQQAEAGVLNLPDEQVKSKRRTFDVSMGVPKPTGAASPLDSFVGRSDELASLDDLFREGARLVTIKGTGGAGKTRLAWRFSDVRREEGRLRRCFVDLTEARSPMGIVHATAIAMKVPLGGADFEGLMTQLGHAMSARGDTLIILDNFEQLVAHGPQTIGRWLEMAPDAQFLVTSREPLRIRGERVVGLDPLPEAEGVALFQIRAASAGASLGDTSATRQEIREIVQQLDGLPLAIELAAARARVLAPRQILERLSQRFKLLNQGARGDSKRQISLVGLMDWSWELLEPWEKAALSQLSVFRDGFFVEAAEAVLDLSAWPDAPWSLDVVASLLDKSLLHAREVRGRTRFGMYVSIQQYAAEKMGSDSEVVRRRHAAHYASFGREAFVDLLDTHGGVERRRTLLLELENLLAGVSGGLSTASVEEAVGCVLGAVEIFRLHGPFSDGIALLEQVEADLHQPVGLTSHGRLTLNRALLLELSGRPADASSHYNQALAIFEEIGDRRSSAQIFVRLASLAQHRGKTIEALKYLRDALGIVREVRDRRSEGILLGNLANVFRNQGAHADALTHQEQALSIAQEVGDRRYEGVIHGNMANVHQDKGRLEQAQQHFLNAVSIAQEVGDRRGESIILGNLALLYASRGLFEEAWTNFEKSLAISREVGNRRGEGATLGNLGDLMVRRGETLRAERYLRDAVAICDENFSMAAGAFRGSLALICAQQGQVQEALAMLEVGEGQLRGAREVEFGKFLCKKTRVECLGADVEAAARSLQEAEAIWERLGGSPNSDLSMAIGETRQWLVAHAITIPVSSEPAS